ncbi:hypothetical protein [Sporohalobacter salinus]|uniref:hypothetical protein n=1 Tax=Sporohalobacter salinus TaxID=1494606 RepID=UPI0019601FFF|nr:hypothetical protein [Sporohalobacter salinus]MBM7623635.1 hypothetical protein [Sporohalobacter salinus]
MQIKKVPQFNPREQLFYTFEPNDRTDVILVEFRGTEEEFDFSQITTDGVFDVQVDKLDINPFREVKRENGELKVKLDWYYSNPDEFVDSEGNPVVTDWEVV